MRKLVRWGTTTGLLVSLAAVAQASGTGGTLDASFGSGGVELGESLSDAWEHPYNRGDVAIDASGSAPRIVTVRAEQDAADGTFAWSVARHLEDGTPDTSFDADGRVLLFGGVSAVTWPRALAVAPDGKILIAGDRSVAQRKRNGSTTWTTSGVVVRLDTDGSLDASFGSGGVLDTGARSAHALALEVSGSGYDVVVAAATLKTYSTGGKGKTGGSVTSRALKVLRYDDGGALLGSFEDDFGDSNEETPHALRLDSQGRVIVALNRSTSSGGVLANWVVSRYAADGTLDASFGNAGRFIESGASLIDIALDSTDRVVASGAGTTASLVRRYDDDQAEALPIPNDWALGEAEARDVAVDASDRIVVMFWIGDTDWNVTVARYTADGDLDTSFGAAADGVGATFDDGNHDYPGPMAIDASGRIVGYVTGVESTSSGYTATEALVRWLGD